MLEYPLLLVFPVAMAFAGVMDLLTYRIPNHVSLALLLGFLFSAPLAGMPLADYASHLGAGAMMLAIGIAMFSRGWLGGGDAKLLAAAALWLGFGNLMPFLVWTAIFGGALAVILLMYRRILPPLWLTKQDWAMRLHDSRHGIPYGIALAGAGMLVYPTLPWIAGLSG